MTIKAQDEWCVECRNMHPRYLEGCPNKTKSAIPKEIIEEAAETNERYSSIRNNKIAFIQGVQFAEEYLKDLAVEFAEWIIKYAEPVYQTGKIGGYQYMDQFCTSQELFEIFIKEKYESNSTD